MYLCDFHNNYTIVESMSVHYLSAVHSVQVHSYAYLLGVIYIRKLIHSDLQACRLHTDHLDKLQTYLVMYCRHVYVIAHM